jgi:hypothetical protein
MLVKITGFWNSVLLGEQYMKIRVKNFVTIRPNIYYFLYNQDLRV